ncbi:YHS domain protein [bacterium BMS3Abin03]|nr:YHS domain protein [bacterium BMS3Abin03]
MVHDLVCGMEIKDTSKAVSLIYEGKTYYFCTDLCKIQFEQNPEKYIKKNNENGNDHSHHKH